MIDLHSASATGRIVTPALFALLILFAGWVYLPGIAGPDLLDDRSSVLVIGNLQEKPERAMDYVLGDRSGKLGRAVSMSTFVAERLYLGEELAISKSVNIVIHLLNGALIIWLFSLLFRHIEVPAHRELALVLGAVWLLHPLLVSTVLYVVQRMAMLATFFMLLTTICYIYWRRTFGQGLRVALYFIPVLLFFLLALFSKENAIVLVPILLLLEVWWFRCLDNEGRPVRWLKQFSWIAIFSGALGLLAVLVFRYEWLAGKFHRRPFTMEERLLTQARVVWDYIGQWLRPETMRMGIYHDDVLVSRSLTDPASTLYALVGWLMLLVSAAILCRWKWGRFLVLGLAWFLLGHSVESTLLSLELYFEHRNYFPAIGLVLALGVIFGLLMKRLPAARWSLLACLSIAPLLLAAHTSSQVQVWSSRPLLILNHLNGHPQSARANIDMAVELARQGDISAALRYSAEAHRAGGLERVGDREVRDIALACVAGAEIPDEQIDNLGRVDKDRPLGSVSTLLTLVRIIERAGCPGMDSLRFADRMAEIFLVDDYRRRGSAQIFFSLGVLENALQRWENAYGYADRFLALSPGDKRGLLMKLHFATALGKVAERDEVIATLQSLQDQGGLTVGEQQTLALYLEK